MCTACVVPVKRLRRTEKVRGTFEGVSAPRECGQPSPLHAHRTPYGSRHFRSPRGFIPRGLFVYVATRHRLPTHTRCLPSICPSFKLPLRFIRPRLLAAFCSRPTRSVLPINGRKTMSVPPKRVFPPIRCFLSLREKWGERKNRFFLITIGWV